MKRIEMIIIALSISLIMLLGVVSAQGETNYPPDNLIGRIISSIQEFLHKGQFTIYGTNMGCGVDGQPQSKVYLKNYAIADLPRYYFFEQEKVCGGKSFFVNFYRGSPGNDQYLGEYYYYKGTVYVTDGSGKGGLYLQKYTDQNNPFYNNLGLSCDAGGLWANKCYVEIYCCSQGACESNSDCSSSKPTCDKTSALSILFPQLGVCQPSVAPTRQVSVYQCNSDGTANYLKNISSTDTTYTFCPEGTNNYLTIGGTSSGVCYSSDNIPCTNNQAVKLIKVQIGITIDELNQKTTGDLLKSICSSTEQCQEGSSCITLKSLKDDKKITASKSQDTLDELAKRIVLPATGAIVSTTICTSLVAAGTIVTAGATAWLLPLCALVGSSAGYLLDSGARSLFEGIRDKNDQTLGYCMIEETSGDFFKTIAFFDINGDGKKDSTDGMFILFGGIALVFLLLMMGGRK